MPQRTAPDVPRVTLIAAVARNGIIGTGNALPWRLPEDLRRFKALTLGHAVIMGRKTWESIGRPLPGRRNIVVSRNPRFSADGGETAASLDAALRSGGAQDEVFVIGGGELYAQAIARAQRLYLTEIDADFEGDARFPALDRSVWREVSREHHRAAGGFDFDFVTYERN